MRWKSWIVGACCVFPALLCLWIAPANAQKVKISQAKVSLEVEKAEFLPTVEKLFMQAGVRCRITPAAKAIAKGVRVTLTTKDVPLERAIRQLLLIGELRYTLALTFEKGTYVLKPAVKRTYPPKLVPRNVSLSLKDATLEEALLKVFQQTGVSYGYTLDGIITQKITLELKDVPHQKALAMLLEAARPQSELTYSQAELDEHNYSVYIAGVYPPMGSFKSNGTNTAAARRQLYSRKITVYLRDENFYFAVDAVLRLSGANYTLDPRLRDYHIASMSFKNASLGEVLDRLFAEIEDLYRPRYEYDVISVVPQEFITEP